jgi:hypothetical protein
MGCISGANAAAVGVVRRIIGEKIECGGVLSSMSIYDLPRDVLGVVMVYPFYGLRQTCKWFRDLTRGMFAVGHENGTTVISSARYSYILPKLHCDGCRPVVWSRSGSYEITWDQLYRPLCNFILVPQWSCEHNLVVACEDDELRCFASMLGCRIYKLWKITIGKYEICTDRYQPVGITQYGGAFVVARDNQLGQWSCTWYMHVHICDVAAAIRVADGPVCVYVEIAPA